MSFPDDAGGTFEGRLGCPSELVLDRWATGELSPRSTGEIETHLAGCDVCRRRMDARRSGFSSVPALDAAAALALVRRRLAEPSAAPSPAPAPPPSASVDAPLKSPPAARAAPSAARPSLRRHAWLLLVPLFALAGALAVRWLLRLTGGG